MRVAAMAVALMSALSAGPARAQAPVVVELFTSQGCSACPPADAYFGDLALREDVIALALHVDYWDYLGWADPFAQSRFTERQKSYARAARSRMVYTPQMIVAGEGRVEGFRTDEVDALIARHHTMPQPVALRLERDGARLRIVATADPPLEGDVTVHLVRYAPSHTMTIERGENAGHTDTYYNIVTEWHALAHWSGDAPFAMDVTTEGDEPVVVLVQRPGPGAILAARLR
jgi:hypothetical protein